MLYRMFEKNRIGRTAIAAAFVITAMTGASALAHTDVPIENDGTTLHVPPVLHGDGHLLFVYEGDLLPTVLDEIAETDEPGFLAPDGTYTPGTSFSFMALSGLLYTDGVSTPGAAPSGHSLLIGVDLLVDGDSYAIGVADPDGGIHEDPFKTLDSGTASVAPTPGIYAFIGKVTSPSFEDSNPFMIALNWGLPEEDFEEGLDLLAEEFGLEAEAVPTPSAAGMMLVAGVLAGMRRKRRG